MLRIRLTSLIGDDLEEAWDLVRSVPGAFGNIVVGVLRQVRPIDLAAFSIVIAGLVWLVIGQLLNGQRPTGFYVVSTLPLVLWFTAGVVAGFVFHVGAIGGRALRYWESYMLILLFGVFGTVSLRLALDPRDRRVFHAPPEALDATAEPASPHT